MLVSPKTWLSRVAGPLTLTLAFSTAASGQMFQDQTSTRFPSPNPAEYTNYVAIADLDNDGDLDLVFANGGNFGSEGPDLQQRIFINDGNGFFTDESTTRLNGIAGNYRGVDSGDFDDDGDLDLILSQDFNSRPALLVNDGTGVFTDLTGLYMPAPALSSTRAAFGDIDNDGDLDIYINHGGPVNRFGCGQNRIFVNDGTGFYTDETSTRHPLGNVCEPMDVIFGDIDNDFDLDIRTGNRGVNNSRLYRNDGTGVFTDISGGLPGDSQCYSYDFGDINGDGNLDMLGANAGPGNTELLLEGNGTGTFANVSSQISPNPSFDDNDSKFFDLDFDGDLDLIVARIFGVDRIYLNDGAGNFTQQSGLVTSVTDTSLDVMVADLNGDGRPDIVTGQGESGNFQNRIYINTTGSTDTLPPDVQRTEQAPDTCNAAGPYPVRAAIFDDITSDHGFFDDGVDLNYSVNSGPVQQVPMKWVGNSLWRGVIPGQSPGSTVEYFVTASDRNGNQGTGVTLSFGIEVLPGDANLDGTVNVQDLVEVILDWGCTGTCVADVNNDMVVNVQDLVEVILGWGGCPD